MHYFYYIHYINITTYFHNLQLLYTRSIPPQFFLSSHIVERAAHPRKPTHPI